MKKAALWISLFLLVVLNTITALNAYSASWLRWTKSTSQDVVGYIIYYNDIKPIPEDHKSWKYFKTIENVDEYPITELNLAPGIEYDITVVAYNSAGQSGRSNVIQYIRPIYSPPGESTPNFILIHFDGILSLENK